MYMKVSLKPRLAESSQSDTDKEMIREGKIAESEEEEIICDELKKT